MATGDRHSQYCELHQRQRNHQFQKYQRDSGTAERYNGAWRIIRQRYLTAEPLCELCKANGIIKPATEVHHKTALANGGTNDWSNLQALCHECHSSITRTEVRHRDPYRHGVGQGV